MALLAPVYASTTESKPGEPTITYNYDSLSRLTRADYASGGADRDWFRVENLQYDRQGNILTLNRNDEEGTAIDQLNYNYSGTNRLQNVGDAYGSTPSLDWDAEPASFDYDPNGNLIARVETEAGADSTLFDYDHRNLPLKVTFPGRRKCSLSLYRRWAALPERGFRRRDFLYTGWGIRRKHL